MDDKAQLFLTPPVAPSRRPSPFHAAMAITSFRVT